MPKCTPYATNWFDLLNDNAAYANVGDAGGLQPSAAPGNLYVSLHTGDPGLTGDQTVNEATYAGYGRVAVPRSALGWTVATNQVSNAANIVFGLCTATPNVITWFGVGTAASGAGQLLYAFPLIQTYYACHGDDGQNKFHNDGTINVNDPIQFVTAPGGPIPGPFVQGTTYFVKALTGPNQDFTASATVGGAVINITVSGFCLFGVISPLSVVPGVTPEFLAGQLILSEV